jgi:hypothetical protein
MKPAAQHPPLMISGRGSELGSEPQVMKKPHWGEPVPLEEMLWAQRRPPLPGGGWAALWPWA